MHELRALGAAAATAGGLGAAVPERVHHVAGEDEQQVGGAAVADCPQRAQGHEQEVHPVREPEHAADAHRPLAGAGARWGRGTHLLVLLLVPLFASWSLTRRWPPEQCLWASYRSQLDRLVVCFGTSRTLYI